MDIKSIDTNIQNAIDQYYEWLLMLLRPEGNFKVALLSSLVQHDVIEHAPLTAEYVFRGFADRTISVSPADLGAGSTNDRYSAVYDRVIAAAAGPVRRKYKDNLSDRDIQDLASADTDIGNANDKINEILTGAAEAWDTYSSKKHLKEGTPEYAIERSGFFGNYYQQVLGQHTKITQAASNKRAIWAGAFGADSDAEQLNEIYEALNDPDSFQTLPYRSDDEISLKINASNIIEYSVINSSLFEKRLAIRPSSDLTKLLDETGQRELELKAGGTVDQTHSSAWGGHAGASWLSVIQISGSKGDEDGFKISLQHLESIKINFTSISEFWVDRGSWYSTDMLGNKYVKAVLDKNPKQKALLSMSIASMVIARGLQVTYKFKDVADLTTWANHSWGGGGGVTIMGVSLGLGGGGGGESHDINRTIDTVEKSITFKDGDHVCRLVALRVQQLIDMPQSERALYTLRLEDSDLGLATIDAWKSGHVPMGVYVDAELLSQLELK